MHECTGRISSELIRGFQGPRCSVDHKLWMSEHHVSLNSFVAFKFATALNRFVADALSMLIFNCVAIMLLSKYTSSFLDSACEAFNNKTLTRLSPVKQ